MYFGLVLALGFRPAGLGHLRCLSKWCRVYLWPEKPTFLGFLIVVSIHNSLKRSVWGAKGRVYDLGFRV